MSSVSAIAMATTNRQRLRRTRLSGCFHLTSANTRVPGAVSVVMGQKKIRERVGTASEMESYRMREESGWAARAAPLPAATHEGHQTWPPNSTLQSSHTKRPHWLQAATARLPAWSKDGGSAP